jgi:hypothetical protein
MVRWFLGLGRNIFGCQLFLGSRILRVNEKGYLMKTSRSIRSLCAVGLLSGLGATVLVGALLLGSGAALGQTPSGGAVQVWGTPGNNGGGSVLFTGAVADSGKSASVNSSAKPDKKGNYKLFTLKKGTILINGTQINAALNNASPTEFNSTTCSGSFTATAPVPIVSGTKLYAGISGTVNVTVTFAVVLPLTKGTCNMNTNANPIAQYGSIAGTGTVSF